MGNRAPERTVAGPLRVDMDPLAVASRLREEVHLLLGDLVPGADSKLGADQLPQPSEFSLTADLAPPLSPGPGWDSAGPAPRMGSP